MLFRHRIHDPFAPFHAPFSALRGVQIELERWMGHEGLGRSNPIAMALFEREDDLLVRTPLPGLEADQISIEVEGNALTLSGTWPEDPAEASAGAKHLERPRDEFRRTLRLPFDIDSTRVQARLEHGVLEVELPRVQKTPPTRIPVNAEPSRSQS